MVIFKSRISQVLIMSGLFLLGCDRPIGEQSYIHDNRGRSFDSETRSIGNGEYWSSLSVYSADNIGVARIRTVGEELSKTGKFKSVFVETYDASGAVVKNLFGDKKSGGNYFKDLNFTYVEDGVTLESITNVVDLSRVNL